MTDTERIDFLEKCVMENGHCVSANRDFDCYKNSPHYGYLPTVTLFTVPSQHVKGDGFRGAIDKAIEKSKLCSEHTL